MVILITVICTTLFWFLSKFLWEEFINRRNRQVHITKEIINEGYEKVWDSLSDVKKYPKLYPGWVSEVEKIEENYFKINGQYGNIYKAKRELGKEKGIINLKMGPEVSRTRLLSLEDNKTLALHIGERWEDFNLVLWFFYKRTVDSDFKNAKKIIENK
ncbi:hypothetical protein [Sporohalobacter salinus]|uniref:hypothetical protein n=1 Tax=Sporohalobacter salinus TaxID=1494606 RepID=UPI00196112A7|nr:hypothetical protein [Sporohalobacter salinus]MBM7624241.1 hypothetical protein [Sporohalobacter salinus]